jgi:hypothetical protein
MNTWINVCSYYSSCFTLAQMLSVLASNGDEISREWNGDILENFTVFYQHCKFLSFCIHVLISYWPSHSSSWPQLLVTDYLAMSGHHWLPFAITGYHSLLNQNLSVSKSKLCYNFYCHTWSIYIKVNVCMCVCVCMFQHNYLSMNGIVSVPSFSWLYKYKEKYKQGEMWHSAQRAEISEEKQNMYVCMYVCFSLGIARQRVQDWYSRKPTMRNCW